MQGFLFRYFDAAMVAVNGIRDYIDAGYDVTEPQFQSDLCLAEDIPLWQDGETLFTFLQKVKVQSRI